MLDAGRCFLKLTHGATHAALPEDIESDDRSKPKRDRDSLPPLGTSVSEVASTACEKAAAVVARWRCTLENPSGLSCCGLCGANLGDPCSLDGMPGLEGEGDKTEAVGDMTHRKTGEVTCVCSDSEVD